MPRGHLQKVQALLADNGNEHHEEGELRHGLPLDAGEKSRSNGAAAAGNARSHGEGLSDSHYESLPVRDAVPGIPGHGRLDALAHIVGE